MHVSLVDTELEAEVTPSAEFMERVAAEQVPLSILPTFAYLANLKTGNKAEALKEIKRHKDCTINAHFLIRTMCTASHFVHNTQAGMAHPH